MPAEYQFLPDLFLRAPYYSFAGYDLGRLPEVLGHQAFRNAIYLASPDFHKVLAAKDFDFEKMGDKEKHTLYKYYNRMCFRPTPFGSFASFTLLEWGSGDTVRLSADQDTRLHLLPDMELVQQLRTVKNNSNNNDRLIKNPTLYRVGKEYRYVKSKIDEKGHYRFSLDAVAAEKFYIRLFPFLKKNNVTLGEVLQWIIKYAGCSAAEAADYLEYLLEEQILYSPQAGNVINGDKNRSVSDLAGFSEFWCAHENISLLSSRTLASAASEFEALISDECLNKTGSYFYAAMERNLENGGLGDQDKEELGSAIHFLAKLATPHSLDVFDKFKAEFKDRFDQQKVPLLTALDPDTGISYGNFGIAAPAKGFEDIRFPQKQPKEIPVFWTATHRWLFALWGKAKSRGYLSSLSIQADDLAELDESVKTGLLPSSLAVMFRKTDEYLLIEHIGGAAATAMVGRFSAFSQQVTDLCQKLVQTEINANSGVVFADISQLSNTHTDNINYRAQIYPYEIPVNVYSALPESSQIQLSDLLVSVRNDELILESMKLRKRVIPRLATAYNYQHNELAIFRFLCDLQYQGLRANLNFSLENYFPGLKFYPRVVFQNTVVSLAKWYFENKEITGLKDETRGDLPSRIRRFRDQHGLPRQISIGTSDQQLVFDLGDKQEACFFLQALDKLKKITISEYLLPGRSVKIGNKAAAGQFVGFLSHRRPIYNGLPSADRQIKRKSDRDFLLGGDWLYVKIYCTPESSDRILADVIAPVITANRKIIATWFFIRYFDSGYHLRLRMLAEGQKTGSLLLSIKKQLEVSGHDQLLKNYQGDIYRREMERYGADVIELVEAFFCAGSDLVTRYISLRETDDIKLEEFHLAIYTTFKLVHGWLDGIATAIEFTTQMSERYLKEFAADKNLKTDLDLKYRSIKEAINGLLEEKALEVRLSVLFNILVEKALLIKDSIDINERQSLLADIIHMQLNRTFRVKQRQQELMVYYFLNKYLSSMKARKLKSNQDV